MHLSKGLPVPELTLKIATGRTREARGEAGGDPSRRLDEAVHLAHERLGVGDDLSGTGARANDRHLLSLHVVGSVPASSVH